MDHNEGEGEVDALTIIKEQAEKRREEVNKELQEARDEWRKRAEDLEQELASLRAKREVRRAKQAEERKMMEKFEEERKAKAKEEMKKRKELAEMKKKEREASLRAMHNPNAYKAIIIEKEEPVKVPKKSKEQLAQEKEEAMKERIKPLNIANMAEDKLREIARNLLQQLQSIYGSVFDMKMRRKRQDYDHKELQQRIKDLTKAKEPTTAESAGTVHKFKEGGIFKPQEAEGHRSRMDSEKEAGSIISSGGVAGRMGMFGGTSGKKAPALGREPTIDLTK